MKERKTYQKSSEKVIKNIEITEDKMSSRGGLALYLRYIESIGFFKIIGGMLGHFRKSKKGQAMESVIMQILAYFVDGTRKSIAGFDEVKASDSQAALFEIETDELIGSDIVKRFFKKFLGTRYLIFRKVLQRLFIWRLQIEKPSIINLYLDTMVLDNNDANGREGVKPTYKKKKGFQPLQLIWKQYIVDALFRSGDMHSNHGDDVKQMLRKVVDLIRSKYDKDVAIMVRMDAGFLSEENFIYMEKELKIHFICSGKLYASVTNFVGSLNADNFQSFEGKNNTWRFTDFGSKLDSWQCFRRTIYMSPMAEECGQMLLEFARPENVLYTNVGMNKDLDQKLIAATGEAYLNASTLIKLYHQNGASELVHRSYKEFAGNEKLPFKRFGANGAYYYLMIIASFLFQSFKEDVGSHVVKLNSYPNTARRRLIDFAAKIVKTAGSVTLKVTRDVAQYLHIHIMWQRCNNPIPITS